MKNQTKKTTGFYLFGGPDGWGGAQLVEANGYWDALRKYSINFGLIISDEEGDAWMSEVDDPKVLAPFIKGDGLDFSSFSDFLNRLDTLGEEDAEKLAWEAGVSTFNTHFSDLPDSGEEDNVFINFEIGEDGKSRVEDVYCSESDAIEAIEAILEHEPSEVLEKEAAYAICKLYIPYQDIQYLRNLLICDDEEDASAIGKVVFNDPTYYK